MVARWLEEKLNIRPARQFVHSRGYVMRGRNHAENESNRIESNRIVSNRATDYVKVWGGGGVRVCERRVCLDA